MRLRRSTDFDLVEALHTIIFSGDEWEAPTAAWVLWNDEGDPVGFCTVRALSYEAGAFLSRAGVMNHVQGQGMQMRMLRVRERWIRSEGLQFAITYCTYSNHSSLANLLKAGYRLYEPEYKWAGDMNYFIKSMVDEPPRSDDSLHSPP